MAVEQQERRDVATRFKPGKVGGPGRPNRAWIRRILNERNPANQTEREQIIRHQIEAAKSWEVKVIGKDQDGELIKVADSKGSTLAAQFVLGLVGYAPSKHSEEVIKLPPGIATEGRPLLDIIADVYRARLLAGQMTEPELHRLTDLFLSIDRTKIALLLKLLGGNVTGKSEEEIRALLAGTPMPERREAAQAANVAPAKDGEADGACESTPSSCTSSPGEDGKAPGCPSPKERDTSAHGSGCENGSIFAGAADATEPMESVSPAVGPDEVARPSCFVTGDDEDDEG